jgi:hypothetical protein
MEGVVSKRSTISKSHQALCIRRDVAHLRCDFGGWLAKVRQLAKYTYLGRVRAFPGDRSCTLLCPFKFSHMKRLARIQFALLDNKETDKG